MPNIPKKLRFEVFKRDSFKCQYCGRSAPEIILHCDHILPRAKGGKNTLLNLITSCEPCNLGKSDRTLSDGAAVTKAKAQADELQERRNQIEMMAKWYSEMESQRDAEVDIVDSAILSVAGPMHLSEHGRANMKGRIKKHGLALVVEKTQEAFAKRPTDSAGFEECIKRLEKLLKWSGKPLHIQKAAYIAAVVRNKYPKFYGWHTAFRELLIAVLEEFPEESDRFYRIAADGGEIGAVRDRMLSHSEGLGMDSEFIHEVWNNACK